MTVETRPMIEAMESRRMFAFSLPSLDEYIPSNILDIVTNYTPLAPLVGAYNGAASIINTVNGINASGDAKDATIRILKQTAGGLVRGRLSIPGSDLKNIPFAGRLDRNGILKSDIRQEGLVGRVIGKFIGNKFSGKFTVSDATRMLKGLLKLKRN